MKLVYILGIVFSAINLGFALISESLPIPPIPFHDALGWAAALIVAMECYFDRFDK